MCITCSSMFGCSGFINDRCSLHEYTSNKEVVQLKLNNDNTIKAKKARENFPEKLVRNRITKSYTNAIEQVTTDSKQYFKERCGFYEEQPLCKHCSVISTKNIDLKSFQQFSSLGFSNIKRLVNNTYDLQNYNHMKLIGITNSFKCIINKGNNHSRV